MLSEQCISTVSYTVMVNGVPSKEIFPSRGLRQGDPLSPYLFILMSGALTRLIEVKKQSSRINGIKLNRRCPTISHSFFADDTMVFGGSRLEEVEEWKHILDLYCQASGQRINFDKSSLRFSSNCTSKEK